MKPTKKQTRRFWEWCGVEPEIQGWATTRVDCNKIGVADGEYFIPATTKHGREEIYPDLDLNNLFQWAVPKVNEKHRIEIMTGKKGCSVYIYKYGEDFSIAKSVAEPLPLELPLFRAIKKLIEEEI